MVSYIFVVAVLNLAFGFLLAAYLGRRYRALEAASASPPAVEAVPEDPQAEEVAESATAHVQPLEAVEV